MSKPSFNGDLVIIDKKIESYFKHIISIYILNFIVKILIGIHENLL